MKYDLIVARYGEVGLKSSKVRSRFERKLVKNIKSAIDCDVDRNQGRIYIFPKSFDDAVNNLNRVFGIVSYLRILIRLWENMLRIWLAKT